MKGIFTTKVVPEYDDLPERRYHFPSTYLKQVERCVGDWIVYYEPRRSTGNQPGGRQVYFATAMVNGIRPDAKMPGHYYADVQGYFEFPRPVPFREGQHYFESMLQREDGATNKGAFGRAVRGVPDEEFWAILQAGIASDLFDEDAESLVAEPPTERASVETFLNRKVRDPAFRRLVRQAYDLRCAVSGLRLINGGGRPEVQAAHIMPVEHNGPDTVRNGIALSGTVHWLFDRGLISFGDDGSVLESPHGLPDEMGRLIRPERRLLLPPNPAYRPHPAYLQWHRENQFKR
ncbi:MAG: restriction endonuclease [Spiribacter salinus]|uniref:Restriction endonuclease n=1 Tax=Spiribacter salinus TaxID=1335746 RepID=A0A540VMX6_9GAMM|nr:MAG: restriction endonuclease [Spiribacter salinus]